MVKQRLWILGCQPAPSPNGECPLSITDAGSSQHIGTQIAAVSHVDLALRGRLHFRLGGGLGWTQKPWDARTRQGRERVVLGSAINGAAQIGLGFLSSLNPVLWHEHVGLHLRLDHQSNASFTQPNLGTNVVSLSVSTHLRKKPSLFRASDGDYLDILPAPIHGGYVFLGVGQRQPSPLSAREDVLECGYEYRLGQQSRIGYITGALLMLRPGALGLQSARWLSAPIFPRVHRLDTRTLCPTLAIRGKPIQPGGTQCPPASRFVVAIGIAYPWI